jgi:hypothetical protein
MVKNREVWMVLSTIEWEWRKVVTTNGVKGKEVVQPCGKNSQGMDEMLKSGVDVQ